MKKVITLAYAKREIARCKKLGYHAEIKSLVNLNREETGKVLCKGSSMQLIKETLTKPQNEYCIFTA
jgi:hypothetical protein